VPPLQRDGSKVRQRRRVVERRRIPCEQQVDALVQEIARVVWSREKPNGRAMVARDPRLAAPGQARRTGLCGRSIGSGTQWPGQTGNGPRDGQVRMSERKERIRALARQRDREDSVVDGHDRLDEATDVGAQLGVFAIDGPGRANIGRRDRRAVGEAGVLPQRDHPRAPIGVEPPGRCQAGPHTSMTVDADQRLVQLAEQHSLALVRGTRSVRGIDSVAERYSQDRFARLGDHGTVVGVCLDPWNRCRRRLWRRLRCGGRRTRDFRRRGCCRRRGRSRRRITRTARPCGGADRHDESDRSDSPT
jgi:hypothetical protein